MCKRGVMVGCQGDTLATHTHVRRRTTLSSRIQSQDWPIKPVAVVLETSKTCPDLHSTIKKNTCHTHT